MRQIPEMGTKRDAKRRRDMARRDDERRQWGIDRARKLIFEKGYPVESKAVDVTVGGKSGVPIQVSLTVGSSKAFAVTTRCQNAFSLRLFEHGFDFYRMFVPDLMHEFELGVWKAIFTHLLRILYANGKDAIQKLNERYVYP